jgi:hypothetical protein
MKTVHLASASARQIGIRVVNLYAAFDTEQEPDFREQSSDALHPRLRSYRSFRKP